MLRAHKAPPAATKPIKAYTANKLAPVRRSHDTLPGQPLDIYVKTGSVTALVINLNGLSWGDGFTPPTSIDGNTPIKLYFTDGYWLKNQ